MTERDCDGNGNGIAITGCTEYKWIDNYECPGYACALQVISHGGLHVCFAGPVQNGDPCSFPRAVRNNLLDHDHAPEFDHPENQEEKDGRNQCELDGGNTSSISSAQPINFLQFRWVFERDSLGRCMAFTLRMR